MSKKHPAAANGRKTDQEETICRGLELTTEAAVLGRCDVHSQYIQARAFAGQTDGGVTITPLSGIVKTSFPICLPCIM